MKNLPSDFVSFTCGKTMKNRSNLLNLMKIIIKISGFFILALMALAVSLTAESKDTSELKETNDTKKTKIVISDIDVPLYLNNSTPSDDDLSAAKNNSPLLTVI